MAFTNGFSSATDGFLSRRVKSPAQPAWIRELDSLPPPDWEGLDLKKYFSQGGMGNLQSKRGCPFSCIYCTYPLIEGRKVRLRSPAKVAQDAEDLIRRGVENAFMVDNIFNFPETHARDVCRALVEKRIPLQWSCYAHPSYFSPALAEEMKMAGCTGVEFGTDSGAPQVLAKLGKNFTPQKTSGEPLVWPVRPGWKFAIAFLWERPERLQKLCKKLLSLWKKSLQRR